MECNCILSFLFLRAAQTVLAAACRFIAAAIDYIKAVAQTVCLSILAYILR